ncbi:MAG: isoprenylcysteine carboxylmethyltransferase family protein [Chloroflexota bacterium]
MTRLPSLGPRGEGWVLIQFVLLGIVAVVPFFAGGAWDATPRAVTTAIGGVLGLGGAVLAARGVVDLRDALTPLPHPRDGASLVDTGSYGLVRHPIYGGLVIGCAGWSLVTASPLTLILTVVLLVFFRLKSGREEAWLRERHAGYEVYAARTRRMLPFIY